MGIRIAIFSDYTGGVSVFSDRLAKTLSMHGYVVVLITYDPVNASEEHYKTDLEHCGVQVVCLKRNFNGEGAELTHALKKIAPDIFIPNYRRVVHKATAKLMQNSDIKVLGVCHNDHESYYSLLSYYNPMISAFICPSMKTFNSLAALLPKRISDLHCIPHGVPVSERTIAPYDGDTIILAYHGRLDEEQKYLSKMLQVAEELYKRGVKFNLKLIGDGPSRSDYERFVKLNNLGDHVVFFGHLKWDLLQKELLSSHLALLTSKYEGYCYGLAEAMGMGLPAITFETGGVVEEYVLDGENGFVVPWGNISLFADKVCQLKDDSALWRTFSEAAKAKIKTDYSIELWSERMAELINCCAKGKSRRWPLLVPTDSESMLSRVMSVFKGSTDV